MHHYLEDDSGPGTALPNIVALIDVSLFLLFALMVGTAGAGEHELEARLARVREAARASRPSRSTTEPSSS